MPLRGSRSLAVIFLSVTALCTGLGIWQLGRLEQRREANAVAAARQSLPPIVFGARAREPERARERQPDSALAGRRVRATGRFDYDRTVVVRGQVMEGVPGVHAITPLFVEGTDTALLVNRGFVPSPDAVSAPLLDSLRPGGALTVEGIALPIDTGRGQPVTRGGRTSWARLDLARLRDSLPYPVFGVQVRRIAAGAEARDFPRAVAAPSLDTGPHLNYALQWFGFAIVALVFAVAVSRKRA